MSSSFMGAPCFENGSGYYTRGAQCIVPDHTHSDGLAPLASLGGAKIARTRPYELVSHSGGFFPLTKGQFGDALTERVNRDGLVNSPYERENN
jgi:hypothetical protein